MKHTIFTDGCCEPNPGDGGWAYVILDPNTSEIIKENFGGQRNTTNNRMEIMGVLQALKYMKAIELISAGDTVHINSDSKYVVNSINHWLKKWIRKNDTEKLNLDLWIQIYEFMKIYELKALWVPGHKGVENNERADELSRQGRATVTGEEFHPIFDISIKELINIYPDLNFSAVNLQGDKFSLRAEVDLLLPKTIEP